MKTGNFKTKVNNRRMVSYQNLSNRIQTYIAEKRKKLDEIESFQKQLENVAKSTDSKAKVDAKKIIEKIENNHISIKNIDLGIAKMNKELEILQKRITTKDVAASVRTKKYRGPAKI